MKVLLDTHVLLWAASDPQRLGAGQELLAGADRRIMSAASVWEMSIKQALGKLDLGSDVRSWTKRAVVALGLDQLDVTGDHAAAVEHLPSLHRDPFDRLLVAQAHLEGALLLTADRLLLGYGNAVRLTG